MKTKSTKDLPFFIAAQHRCGFHYLITCLINSKQFPHIGEGLPDPDCSNGELIAYFDSIKAEFKNFEVWGTKVAPGQMNVAQRYLKLRGVRYNQAKWIWLRRRDIIKGAISYMKALRTNISGVTTEKERIEANRMEVNIPLDRLRERITKRYIHDYGFHHFFKKANIDPLIVYYEDFEKPEDRFSTVMRVHEFLGLTYQNNKKPIIVTNILKQSNDEETEAIIEEFMRHENADYLICEEEDM